MYFEWESLRFKLTRHDTFVAKQVDANDCAVNPDHDYIRLRDGNWRKRGYGAVSPEFIRVLDRQVAAYISLTAPRKFAPFNGHRTRTSPNSERPARFRTPREWKGADRE